MGITCMWQILKLAKTNACKSVHKHTILMDSAVLHAYFPALLVKQVLIVFLVQQESSMKRDACLAVLTPHSNLEMSVFHVLETV